MREPAGESLDHRAVCETVTGLLRAWKPTYSECDTRLRRLLCDLWTVHRKQWGSQYDSAGR